MNLSIAEIHNESPLVLHLVIFQYEWFATYIVTVAQLRWTPH